MSRTTDKVVVFEEWPGKWCAHCVDYDIAAWGPDRARALARLGIKIEMDRRESLRRNGAEFAGIDAAPDYIRLRWDLEEQERTAPPLFTCSKCGATWRGGITNGLGLCGSCDETL